MPSSNSEQLAQMQSLLMEHEQTLEHYSELLLKQQQQIDRLRANLSTLEEKLSKQAAADFPGSADETPPHY